MSILHKKISGECIAIKVGLVLNCPRYGHYTSLTILCLLCLCGNRECPFTFENKAVTSKLFFQMSAQVKWEGRPIWSEEVKIYPLNYLLHMGVMLTIIKVFNLFPLCLWEQGKPWKFSKQIGKVFFQLIFQIYFLHTQTEGERKAFFGRVQERRPHCEIISKSTWLI